MEIQVMLSVLVCILVVSAWGFPKNHQARFFIYVSAAFIKLAEILYIVLEGIQEDGGLIINAMIFSLICILITEAYQKWMKENVKF